MHVQSAAAPSPMPNIGEEPGQEGSEEGEPTNKGGERDGPASGQVAATDEATKGVSGSLLAPRSTL